MPSDQAKTVRAATDLAQALADPLNGLLAMGELLQRQLLSETVQVQLQAMLDAGRRMTGMLRDSIEAGDASVSSAPTALRELIDDVGARWRAHQGEEKAQFLISSNAPPDLRVVVDPVRLRRLLNTLIEDAFRARAWGVIEVQLIVQPTVAGVVTVTGRIDVPGAELSACDNTALDLCRAIVDQMDGDLNQRPGVGCGVQTSFQFQAEEALLDLSLVVDAIEEEGPLPARTHLLIVDDNATNRIVAAALCEMFGCTSETAEDGLEAVEAVKARPFDLILMDIKMPRMDGIEATKAIRALSTAAAAIPIVALTANADAEAAATYLAAGMLAVVDKPIKPEQLLSALQWALSQSSDSAPLQSSVA